MLAYRTQVTRLHACKAQVTRSLALGYGYVAELEKCTSHSPSPAPLGQAAAALPPPWSLEPAVVVLSADAHVPARYAPVVRPRVLFNPCFLTVSSEPEH